MLWNNLRSLSFARSFLLCVSNDRLLCALRAFCIGRGERRSKLIVPLHSTPVDACPDGKFSPQWKSFECLNLLQRREYRLLFTVLMR